ncbi:MAG: hypothetical protein J0H14_22265 [Alphaproteobacteria bacterium]|nr:hypothetical protein [Alphaproteobacteria bacterium]
MFALRDLYQAAAPAGGSIAGYKVALRSDQSAPNNGRLMLGDVDVTDRTDFTADEFNQLHFVAGPSGSTHDLVVVARTGTRRADGTLSGITDSPAVQIIASVTGARSINAIGALLTQTDPTGSDANFLKVARDASIFAGFGSQSRPALSTAGNFTAAAGDMFALRDLYTATAPAGSSIAGYKVALRSDQASPNDGRLMLGDVDVTDRTDFTADEFNQLHFVAGPSGSTQDVVVVTRTGTRRADGTLLGIIDSPAVQITASVTGSRSINAIGALLNQTDPTASDANFIKVARDASIFTGLASTGRPSLSTVGNLTAASGDMFALRDLYTASAPAGGSIAAYKVALRSDQGSPNDGRLMLGDVDVTDRVDFTADEFNQLHFVAGPSGSNQDLVVVARTGMRGKDGTLSGITDSPAVQITASITGARSINAIGALLTPTDPTASDANFLKVARDASIFTGFGSQGRPSLSTAGNFTAAGGDMFALRDLYQATAPAGGSIAGYKVALRSDQASPNDGRLMLGDVDVTGRVDFTADEFNQLHFVVGPSGSNQDVVVVARTGTHGQNGTLLGITDSPAVQITANVTGARSINAIGALLTPTDPTASDANFLKVARDASIFTGLGPQSRPSLSTAGNFTAVGGDMFALRDLYAATAPAGGSIAGYKVALRSDQALPNGGRLMLGDVDVTDRTDFTADEFNQLHFVAGPSGSTQDLVVVARTGTHGQNGTLSGITDSPAVQITASVTGERSVNAIGALLTQTDPTGSDANFIKVARDASVFTGSGLNGRPSLSTVGGASGPQIAVTLLAGLLGAYQLTEPIPLAGSSSTPSAATLLSQYPGAIGGSQTLETTGQQQGSNPSVASWALDDVGLGGFQTGGANLALQRFAVAAYQASQRTS